MSRAVSTVPRARRRAHCDRFDRDPRAGATARGAMSRARILAVDDQRYFRELVEGLLKDEGFEVRTASSGEEALGILERELFEVVVTDLVMPGIDGAELVHRIKEWLPEQEIVVVSGVVDAETAVQAMKLGATDYICKPFDGPARPGPDRLDREDSAAQSAAR